MAATLRNAFTRQPFHYLLIDIGSLPEMTISNICNSLTEVMALSCSIRGSARISVFGLAAIGDTADYLLPLQSVQGNYQQIFKAISQLNVLAKNSSCSVMDIQLLRQCFEEAVGQFNAFKEKTGAQIGKDWQHLKITLMVHQSCINLTKQIEEMLTAKGELCGMIKMQIVGIESVLPNVSVNMDSSSSRGSSVAASQESTENGFNVMVDALMLHCDPYELVGFFKTWLHDHYTDKEHLRLKLPPDPKTGIGLTVLCDIFEIHLNPGAFVFGNHFFISIDPLVSHGLLTTQAKHTNGSQLPVVELEAFRLIRASGICESLVFGIPFRLQPTSCWKIDWSDLETNRQNFQALVQTLKDEDCILVARLKQSFHRVQPTKTVPLSAYFGIFPSNDSMLVKSLAAGELLLPPAGVQFDGEYLPEEAKTRVKASVDGLPMLDSYNPVHFDSGLCGALKICLGNGKASKGPEPTGKPFWKGTAMLR